ncbi:hypothetical protein [Volucribacter amazonae]|uniref:Uncharacterized protein n=1 Tax=Volucribacter amazonae TaxID=256731 RepID=A0A9X4SJ01_9PAST|nr:hypothetical protein [Volucribacter amazonae]MDG6896187.1 hypothetical protein [Volucribacter amazonae]
MKKIIVPKNKLAMKKLDLDQCEDKELVELNLSDEEFLFLYNLGVFAKINIILDKYIGDYEDDSVIGQSDLVILREIFKSFGEHTHHLLKLTDIAIENNTGMFFISSLNMII